MFSTQRTPDDWTDAQIQTQQLGLVANKYTKLGKCVAQSGIVLYKNPTVLGLEIYMQNPSLSSSHLTSQSFHHILLESLFNFISLFKSQRLVFNSPLSTHFQFFFPPNLFRAQKVKSFLSKTHLNTIPFLLYFCSDASHCIA